MSNEYERFVAQIADLVDIQTDGLDERGSGIVTISVGDWSRKLRFDDRYIGSYWNDIAPLIEVGIIAGIRAALIKEKETTNDRQTRNTRTLRNADEHG